MPFTEPVTDAKPFTTSLTPEQAIRVRSALEAVCINLGIAFRQRQRRKSLAREAAKIKEQCAQLRAFIDVINQWAAAHGLDLDAIEHAEFEEAAQ
jgi:hypothetical protein